MGCGTALFGVLNLGSYLLLLLLQARLPRKFPEPDNQGGEEGEYRRTLIMPATGEGMSARPALQSFGNAAGSPHKYAQQVSHIEHISMSVYFPFLSSSPGRVPGIHAARAAGSVRELRSHGPGLDGRL